MGIMICKSPKEVFDRLKGMKITLPMRKNITKIWKYGNEREIWGKSDVRSRTFKKSRWGVSESVIDGLVEIGSEFGKQCAQGGGNVWNSISNTLSKAKESVKQTLKEIFSVGSLNDVHKNATCDYDD